MSRGIVAALALFLTGCYSASGFYQISPAQGQSRAQREADTEACETSAQSESGYDLERVKELSGVHAKREAPGMTMTIAFMILDIALAGFSTTTHQSQPNPELDALLARTGPYHVAFAACMTARRYSVVDPTARDRR